MSMSGGGAITTPQRRDRSVTILVNLEELLCFNSFLTKLGLKIRNIGPIKNGS